MITGANRGLGAALVTDALSRGAGHVYAGTRRLLPLTDHRVTPLQPDVTDSGDIAAAAREIDEIDVLINNAGLLRFDDLTDHASLSEHLAVNLFGTHALTQGLLPRLIDAHGRLVNIHSISALAPLPVTPAYSVSKAAAMPGRSTDMLRAVDNPESPTCRRGSAIFDGRLDDRDEIFPDPMSVHHRGGVGQRSVENDGACECGVPRPGRADPPVGERLEVCPPSTWHR